MTLREHCLYLADDGPFAVLSDSPKRVLTVAPIVLLNAGLVPHAGPYRLHVWLARRLAAAGVASVRLDQAGKGESPRRNGGREALLLDDFARLQDALARHDQRFDGRVQLFGLCSGADDALLIAEAFDTVTGLVLLDGYAPVDLGFRRRYVTQRLFSPDWWRRRFTPDASRPANGPASAPADAASLTLRDWREPRAMLTLYRGLLERGTRILALFSGDLAHDYYNGGQALSRALGSVSGLTEVYRDDLNHLLPGEAQRTALCSELTSWLGVPDVALSAGASQ